MMTLQDMVNNGSVTAEGAQLLASIGAEGASFVVHALPRSAGKSTAMDAVLAHAPADLPVTQFYGDEDECRALIAAGERGYVKVAEVGHHGFRGYLAGEEVPRIFRLVEAGYRLATSLHADTPEQVFEVFARNGVDATEAACLQYLIQVKVLGDPFADDTGRRIEAIHRVSRDPGTGGPVWERLYTAEEIPAA